jgi:hypothetical protein
VDNARYRPRSPPQQIAVLFEDHNVGWRLPG